MAVRCGAGHTKSYILLFSGQDKSEFSQQKVRKKSGNSIDSHVWVLVDCNLLQCKWGLGGLILLTPAKWRLGQ